MIINLINNVENKKEELLVKVSEKDSSILLKNHNLDPEEYQDITKEKIENIKFSLTSSVKKYYSSNQIHTQGRAFYYW